MPYSHRASWDEAMAQSMAGLAMLCVIIVLIVSIWVTVKLIQLFIRVLCTHPTNKLLLAGIATVLVALLLVSVTGGQNPALDTLAAIAGGALLFLVALLDIADDTRLRRPLGRDAAVHAVLHEWWPQS